MAAKRGSSGGSPARAHRTRPRTAGEDASRSADGGRSERVSDRPPRDLGREGRRAWRNALASAPWLDSGADRDLLRRFAELHDERAALARTIEREGRLATGSQGQEVEHPCVRMLASVDDRVLKLAAALGLGPAARHRLTGRLDAARRKPNLAPVVDLYAEAEGAS